MLILRVCLRPPAFTFKNRRRHSSATLASSFSAHALGEDRGPGTPQNDTSPQHVRTAQLGGLEMLLFHGAEGLHVMVARSLRATRHEARNGVGRVRIKADRTGTGRRRGSSEDS